MIEVEKNKVIESFSLTAKYGIYHKEKKGTYGIKYLSWTLKSKTLHLALLKDEI